VLARARLGDDAPLPHPPREQDLPERVVDLVRARVREVFALEEDARAAGRFGQARGVEERRRTPRVIFQKRVELGPKVFFTTRRVERRRQLFERGDERLRHEATAVRPPAPALVRLDLLLFFTHNSSVSRPTVRDGASGFDGVKIA
jgi:hypothetical protein